MIAQLQRIGSAGPALTMRLACLVSFFILATSSHADEIATKIDEINRELLASKIEAVEDALTSVRAVAADVVKNGDPRKDQILTRVEELEIELGSLKKQDAGPPDDLRQLVKEFEAIDDRGGWWWIDANNPDKRGPWYRLDKKKKRFTHWFKDPKNGKPDIYEPFSAIYEVLNVDDEDKNIILVRMTYPPKGAEPGEQIILRFNRKTGVIQTPWGFYAQPKS